MLLTALLCVALLVALGAIAGPLLVLDHVLERRRARAEDAALGHLTDPVATLPAQRAASELKAAREDADA